MRAAFGAVPLSEPVSEEEGGGVSAVRVRVQRAFRLPICEYARPDGCFGLPSHPRLAQCGGDPDRRREKSERCEGGGFNVRCRTLRESSDERRGPECRHDLSCAGDDVRRRRGRLPPMAAAFDTPCRRAPDRPHFAVRQQRPYSVCAAIDDPREAAGLQIGRICRGRRVGPAGPGSFVPPKTRRMTLFS